MVLENRRKRFQYRHAKYFDTKRPLCDSIPFSAVVVRPVVVNCCLSNTSSFRPTYNYINTLLNLFLCFYALQNSCLPSNVTCPAW